MAVRSRRSAPARSVRLVDPPDETGLGTFCVVVGDDFTHYTFREIDCEIGGRGFAVHKIGLGELYHVRIGKPGENSCECKGFYRWGRCKHVLGLSALAQAGRV